MSKPDFEFADQCIIKTWATSVLWLAQQRGVLVELILEEIKDEILGQTALTDFWRQEFGEETINHATVKSTRGIAPIMAQES